MSISSSLAAGVSGLNANSQRLATISDNIANSATNGYKRSVADFHSMVVQSGSAAKYSAGGVRTTTTTLIDERGQLQGTSNSTDITVNGRGFLPVTPFETLGGSGKPDLALTTTGSFRPNDEGILVDPAGKVLLGWPAGIDGTFPVFPRDSVEGLEPVNVYHNQFAASPTDEMTVGVNLPASDSDPAAPGSPHDITLEYFGNMGQTETLNFAFTPEGTTANTWNLVITDSSTGGTVGEYELRFADTTPGGGTLESVTEGATGGAWDPDSGVIRIATATGEIAVNIGAEGDPGGITQLESGFAPANLAKNGAPVGSLVNVEIDEQGIVRGVYDTGFSRAIYQVPVIDVPNPNGLSIGQGGMYRLSGDSGPMFLWDAGNGPAGSTAGYSLEGSTTDVAKELTDLIQTQRAYSSNAKVIQTVDEMLQETANLKR